jgi:diguanylate cyclase (GGDEF)-like protein
MQGISTRQEMRFSASMWAIGAVAGALGSIVPHGSGVDVRGWLALSAVAAVIAVWSWHHYVDLPVRVQYVLSVLAAIAVGGALLAAHHSPAVFAVATLYVLPTIYTAAFYDSGAFSIYLVSQGTLLGAILFTSHQAAAPAAWIFLTITMTALGIVVHCFRRALIQLATTDSLTGLPNRRCFETLLDRELAQCQRTGLPLCVAVIDLDHFKLINDAAGHVAGDQALSDAAAKWKVGLRKADVLARYGGDEFVIMFPAAQASDAVDILTRMKAHGLGFSAGIVEANGATPASDLLTAADRACYSAKRAGRGRVKLGALA